MNRSYENRQTISRKALLSAILGFLISFSLAGCFNNFSSAPRSTTSNSTNPFASVTTNYQLYISNVNIIANSGGSSNTQNSVSLDIFFDISKSAGPFTNYCNTSGSPCSCQFSWTEINQTGGQSISISRKTETPILTAQTGFASCQAPDPWLTGEIIDNTSIKLVIGASAGNAKKFNISPYTLIKGVGNASGSFTDSNGTNFQNILRYSCYEQTLKGSSIQSRQDANGYVYGSQFCISKAAGGDSPSQNCPDITAPDFTAETHYYNLYIRESERGDITSANNRYVCPQIKEPLPGLQTGSYYPLDSSFALSMSPSNEFPVGVEAKTKVSVAGTDPVIQSSTCYGKPGDPQNNDGSGLIISCLGFAAKPAPDGTCPALRKPDGGFLNTYRLRRYLTLRPRLYDADGFPLKNGGSEVIQSADVTYVVDRPVNAPTPDPNRPYTMLGPKPCPISYFDRKGVTAVAGGRGTGYPNNLLPSYAGTNSILWDGKNIDGLEFPYFDKATAPKSCSATLPLWSADKSTLTLATVHNTQQVSSLRRIPIRPRRAYTPEYIEDTEFLACAPLSEPYRDAPLHFQKDAAGNVAYCVETVPSQNDNVLSLDYRVLASNQYLGNVRNFTSHVEKNTALNQACTRTTLSGLPANYPATGQAYHPTNVISPPIDPSTAATLADTCDRTTTSKAQTWPFFPLVGSASDVESAISTHSSYQCQITYDGGSGKAGKFTPSQGCCGTNVQVWTGLGTAAPYDKANAHLEPNPNPAQSSCLTPNY